MNRIIASLLFITVIGVLAKINPSSQQDVAVPYFAKGQSLDALVNSDLGVITGVVGGVTIIQSFTVGSSFEPASSYAYEDPCANPQLINAGDAVESFLVFCNGNGSTPSFQTFQYNSTGAMFISAWANYTANGNVLVSASAFVSKQGNVYMADSSDGMIAIVEFQVSEGDFETRVENILDNYNGSWVIQDMHSLPYDAGVSVILNSQTSDEQLFLAVYFNGSIFSNPIPTGQTLQYVGRHRGSSFGYTIGYQVNTPYTIVTSWDLSDRSISNSVQIKGQLIKRNDGHFSTNEMVFVFSETDSSSSYIYELPYSEFGFLPKSVNFDEIDSVDAGNLADGQDGTYIYSFTANESGDVQFSRWTF